MLKVGNKAPAFNLPATTGEKVSLASLRGQKVILYFYPRDQTPGCTQEACDFRDHLASLSQEGVVVLGVSKDSLASHEKFISKYTLPFALLSDADNAVAQKYEAFGEKNMYGRKVLGTIRSTFLIDEHGKLAHIWSPVRVKGHVEQVLATLRGESPPAQSNASTSKKTASKRGASKAPAAKRIAKKVAKN